MAANMKKSKLSFEIVYFANEGKFCLKCKHDGTCYEARRFYTLHEALEMAGDYYFGEGGKGKAEIIINI